MLTVDIMYNTTISCEYNDLESYQTTLLSVFGVDYSKLTEEIQKLYDSIQQNEQLQKLLKKVQETSPWASPDFAFYILFSYEYFSTMHAFLVEILENKTITMFDSLYSIL